MRERPVAWLVSAVIVAAVLVFVVGIVKGTFVAAGTDPHGYVSQADLFSSGALRIDQRFARTMSWPGAEDAFVPPGYRPTAEPGFIGPGYPPGLPMVMAVFQRVWGRTAVFYVIPLMGAATVGLIAILGARMHGLLTGTIAAVLLAANSVFLYQVVQPVSDVAATMWCTLAMVLAFGTSPLAALGAGLAASMALLTRPNLAVLMAILGIAFVWRVFAAGATGRWRAVVDVTLFTVGAAVGCLLLAALYTYLYGSPFVSGYGRPADYFEWANLVPNLDRYPRWLLENQTPLVCLAFLAPWVTPRAWLPLAFSVVVFVSYLFYTPFGRDDFGYLRFLLPTYPCLIVLSVAVALEALGRVVKRTRTYAVVLILLVAALTAWHLRPLKLRQLSAIQVNERRYLDVGRYVAVAMPQEAVFISGLHSGTIRYYSGRLTVRYDLTPPRALDAAINALAEKGYHPYLALEGGEEAIFRKRFEGASQFGALDWPPAVQRAAAVHVRIYDPADRQRYLSGEGMVILDVDFVQKPILVRRSDAAQPRP